MKKNTSILLVYTGGTIGMIKDPETGALRNFDFDQLLEKIPELKLLDCSITPLSFERPLDSSNIQPEHWIHMCRMIAGHYEDYDGFVILHGSDTMSYSASALSFMLENLAKPVIFTGSQLPIGDLRTDAKENLITAAQLASLQKRGRPVLKEVCLYFEYKLYRGNRTTKMSAEYFEAFTSPNFAPLATSGVHLRISEKNLLQPKKKPLLVHEKLETRILVIHLFPGMNPELLEKIIEEPLVRGIVLKTYGTGNAPSGDRFIDILKNLKKRGIPVVNVTQCSTGSVQMGNYETSTRLKKIGVVSGKDITTEAAVTKMMYLLAQDLTLTVFKTIFETSIRGEIS